MTPTLENRRDLMLPTRRVFLQRCAVDTIGAIVLPRWAHASPSWSNGDPFSLGVASGTPSTDGFVLWTRLAPQPLSSDPEQPGGVRPARYRVRYEIATDPALSHIV